MTDQPILANWDEVPDEGALPSMRANATLTRWERRKTGTERLMINIGWQIDDPEKFRGMFQNDNLVVGGDAGSGKELVFDPQQQDSRRLKGLLQALQIPLTEDVEKCLRSAEGMKCAMFIGAPSEKDIAAGYGDRSKVRKYHGLGSIEPGVLEGPGSTPAHVVLPPSAPPPALPQQPPLVSVPPSAEDKAG